MFLKFCVSCPAFEQLLLPAALPGSLNIARRSARYDSALLWRSPGRRCTHTYFISIRMFIQWWFLFLFQFQTAFIFIATYGFHFRLWFSFRFLHAISFCIFLHLFAFLVSAFISSSLSISSLDFHVSCLFLYCVLIFMKKCKEKMWKYLFWSTDHRPVLQNNYVHKILALNSNV